jgi:hypothetical protein
MPKPMGNSRRGPDDLDQAKRNMMNREDEDMQDERSAGASESEPILGDDEKVGPWTEDEEDDELGAASEDDDGGGYQAAPDSQPSESQRPAGDRSRWGSDGKGRSEK